MNSDFYYKENQKKVNFFGVFSLAKSKYRTYNKEKNNGSLMHNVFHADYKGV